MPRSGKNGSVISRARFIDRASLHLVELRCNQSLLFFFQAEDGIRDLTVTGVQTCALPISQHQLTGDACLHRCLWLPAYCSVDVEFADSEHYWLAGSAQASRAIVPSIEDVRSIRDSRHGCWGKYVDAVATSERCADRISRIRVCQTPTATNGA